MTALAPIFEVEPELFVIVAVTDGVADTSILHLPVAQHQVVGSSGRRFMTQFAYATRDGLTPSHWPSACGAVTDGWVYVRGGPLRLCPICEACELAIPSERRSVMSVVTTACKIDGCEQPANTRYDRGPFSRLCADHIEVRRGEMSGPGNSRSGSSHPGGASSTSMVARVRDLVPHARKLDTAAKKLSSAGSNEKLQAEFSEASRRAQAAPIVENLERLEQATKALRRGAPKRQEAQNAYDKAEREFRLKLGEIARELRAA